MRAPPVENSAAAPKSSQRAAAPASIGATIDSRARRRATASSRRRAHAVGSRGWIPGRDTPDAQRWRAARSLEELCELGARFVEGRLGCFPGWGAEALDVESDELSATLARLNRSGLLTLCSQPGRIDPARALEQRAFVGGFATSAAVARLARLARGSGEGLARARGRRRGAGRRARDARGPASCASRSATRRTRRGASASRTGSRPACSTSSSAGRACGPGARLGRGRGLLARAHPGARRGREHG
jgi:hypothetical protein